VDPAEQAKFAHAAKDWWDARSTGGAGLLHALNPVRVGYITQQVAPLVAPRQTEGTAAVGGQQQQRSAAKPLAGMRVADIGCGGGLLSESLARLGATVVGVDPTAAAIACARAHAARDPLTAGITYRHTTVEALGQELNASVAAADDDDNDAATSSAGSGGSGFEDPRFDLVCSLEVVEHAPDADTFVRGCAALVRPGGALVMSTMNRTRKAWLLAILGAEHVGRLLPVGTHDWARFRTPGEMAAAMEGEGLAVRDVAGIVLRPKALRPLSSPLAWGLDRGDVDVNYIMCAARPPA